MVEGDLNECGQGLM